MADDDDNDFEELYAYYRGAVALLRRLGFGQEESHDLAQDAFLRVYRSMGGYRGDAKWAYVEQTVRRVAANAVRAKHTQKRYGDTVSDEVLVAHPDTATPLPDEILRQRAAVKLVREAIAKLKPEDQAVLLLQLGGASHDDMMAVLGISLSAVKSRLNAARARLKDLLGEEPDL